MNFKKIIISLLFILVTTFVVSTSWKNSPLLVLILIVLALIKHKLTPIKAEMSWFLISGLMGAFGESTIMTLSGAWKYSSSDLINFPLWLPFLWGLTGCVGMSLYEGISPKNK